MAVVMAQARMTFNNKVRFLVQMDRLAKPGETLLQAAERLAAALDRNGFRGHIHTAAQGDMDPIDDGVDFHFGPRSTSDANTGDSAKEAETNEQGC